MIYSADNSTRYTIFISIPIEILKIAEIYVLKNLIQLNGKCSISGTWKSTRKIFCNHNTAQKPFRSQWNNVA